MVRCPRRLRLPRPERYDVLDDDGMPVQVVADVVRWETMFDRDARGPADQPAGLCRWTIDLASGRVDERTIDDRPQEFPRYDERLTGRAHRFGYTAGLSLDGNPDLLTGVIRHDLVAGRTTTRDLGTDNYPGEFVFVPNDPGAGEDDGVLMGLLHRPDGTTELRLLDAATLDDVATVHLPVRIPLGFHGNWIPTPT